MNRELQILILEDEPADVELMIDELRRSGVEFHSRQVETADEFFAAMKQQPPDLVLSDHGSPQFDGFTILSMVRRRDPDLPFIFVTGALGEDMAIKAFGDGADDCVLKHQLTNLPGAVKRAMARAAGRARCRQLEAECQRLTRELQQARAQLGAVSEMLHICSSCKKIKDEQGLWEPLEAYFSEHLNAVFSHGLCPDCFQRLHAEFT